MPLPTNEVTADNLSGKIEHLDMWIGVLERVLNDLRARRQRYFSAVVTLRELEDDASPQALIDEERIEAARVLSEE